MQGFEEASVLISTDGLGYKVEQKLEAKAAPLTAAEKLAALVDPLAAVDAAGAVRAEKRRKEMESMAARHGDAGDIDAAAAAQSSGAAKGRLSLRDQLAANRLAADEAWKEKNNPFRPPPGLSEDDYQAHMDLLEAKRTKHDMKREQEQQDFTQFQIALQQKELALREAESKTAALPVGAAVPLPDLEQLDPSLSFQHLEEGRAGAAATLFGGGTAAAAENGSSGAGALLLSPQAGGAVAIPAAAGSSIAGALPPLILLKRKHSSSDAAGGAAAASASSEEKPAKKHKHKHKEKKKDKSESATATATATATSSTTAAAAAPPPPAASSALAGLGAYADDSD